MSPTPQRDRCAPPAGGRIDRTPPCASASTAGTDRATAGDTLASALLANGVHQVATSIICGRPRGIWPPDRKSPTRWSRSTSPSRTDAPAPPPWSSTTAWSRTACPGRAGWPRPGPGPLRRDPRALRRAGRRRRAGRARRGAGRRPLPAPGDPRSTSRPDPAVPCSAAPNRSTGPAVDWVAATRRRTAATPRCGVLHPDHVFGYYDDNFLLAVQRRTDHLGDAPPPACARERVWRIRAAPGRRWPPAPTSVRSCSPTTTGPASCSPGPPAPTCTATGFRSAAGSVVFTTNDSAYAAAADLADAGVRGRRRRRHPPAGTGYRRRTVPRPGHRCPDRQRRHRHRRHRPGHRSAPSTPRTGDGSDEVARRRPAAGFRRLEPAVHLYSQAGGKLRYDPELGAFVPDAPLRGADRRRRRRPARSTCAGCRGRRRWASAGSAEPAAASRSAG